MSSVLEPSTRSLAALAAALGDIPVARIRTTPAPGTATEADMLAANAGDALCELIDGTLVEKAVSAKASFVSWKLSMAVGGFVEAEKLGFLLGEAGFVRLPKHDGRWRSPDVAFYHGTDAAYDALDRKAYPELTPALAVEILSPGNTRREIAGKTAEYFRSGTELVWVIDPETKTAKVYRSPEEVTEIEADGTLDGGDTLPGFSVTLAKLFER